MCLTKHQAVFSVSAAGNPIIMGFQTSNMTSKTAEQKWLNKCAHWRPVKLIFLHKGKQLCEDSQLTCPILNVLNRNGIHNPETGLHLFWQDLLDLYFKLLEPKMPCQKSVLFFCQHWTYLYVVNWS